MRFLLDENLDLRYADFLSEQGHDVTAVARDYPRSLDDPDILALAARDARIIITNDTDFGELVFREQRPHAGVILFRVRARRFATKRDRLAHVLRNYADQLDQFLVVTEADVRVRGGDTPGES